jgi:hypothetical protein
LVGYLGGVYSSFLLLGVVVGGVVVLDLWGVGLMG